MHSTGRTHRVTAYHGSGDTTLWDGPIFLTTDWDCAVEYALEYGRSTGWVHEVEITGSILSPSDLGLAVEIPTDLYGSEVEAALARMGAVGVEIMESHPSGQTAPTILISDRSAVAVIGSTAVSR